MSHVRRVIVVTGARRVGKTTAVDYLGGTYNGVTTLPQWQPNQVAAIVRTLDESPSSNVLLELCWRDGDLDVIRALRTAVRRMPIRTTCTVIQITTPTPLLNEIWQVADVVVCNDGIYDDMYEKLDAVITRCLPPPPRRSARIAAAAALVSATKD